MSTPITKFYANKCVFITGATGFVGKVLVEKLLFQCPDIGKIFILMRPKRGSSPKQRLEDFMKCEYFSKRLHPNVLRSKLEVIVGDITQPELGISREDRDKLIGCVAVVFHSAASVKFDDPLKKCLQFNVIGTKSVVELCKQMKRLRCLVHVSTAYANCHQDHVKEEVYDLKISPALVMKLADELDSGTLSEITEPMFEGRPNTYTFTKALAEQYIRDNRGDLSVAIVRPSIVTSAWKGAAGGWIDNFNGPSGMVLLGTLGIARTMRINPSCTADLIPVDIVANALIAAGWQMARNPAPDLQVYHVTTGTTNPITWYDYLAYSVDEATRAPSVRTVRPPPAIATGQGESDISYFFTTWISEVLFAYVMDLILILAGKKPVMIGIMKRMHRALAMFSFFCQRTWSFPSHNLDKLIELVQITCPEDLENFYLDTGDIQWRAYVGQSYMGIRRFLLKESDATIEKGRRRMKFVKLIYYTGLIAVALVSFYFAHGFLVNMLTCLAESTALSGFRQAWAEVS